MCQLRRPVLRFVPAKACPVFARVQSTALRSILIENSSEEAWLKLFILPKCVLPSSKSRGRRIKHTSIDFLCKIWTRNEFGTLWNLAQGNALRTNHSSSNSVEVPQKLIESAISLAKAGMFGKACNILLSAGLASINVATWQLLLSKHPSCPTPVVPQVPSTPISVEPDFDILGALCSFPKGTAAGPSGLRVQHLLDAASISRCPHPYVLPSGTL